MKWKIVLYIKNLQFDSIPDFGYIDPKTSPLLSPAQIVYPNSKVGAGITIIKAARFGFFYSRVL